MKQQIRRDAAEKAAAEDFIEKAKRRVRPIEVYKEDLYDALFAMFKAGVASTTADYNGDDPHSADDDACADNFEACLEDELPGLWDQMWE